MMQKLKTFKKYSTLSHQPGTPWGHTGNVQKRNVENVPNDPKVGRLLKNTQHFHTNLGHLGGTIGMFTNYFQEVHFTKNYI